MMREALLTGTQEIREAGDDAGLMLARSTGDGVAAGAAYALTSTIERVLADLQRKLGAAPACLVTGGDAGWVATGLRYDCERLDDLVLRGLAIIAGAIS